MLLVELGKPMKPMETPTGQMGNTFFLIYYQFCFFRSLPSLPLDNGNDGNDGKEFTQPPETDKQLQTKIGLSYREMVSYFIAYIKRAGTVSLLACQLDSF